MSINSISKRISSKISKELSLSVEKQSVIEYGLIYSLSQILTITLLLITALAFNIVYEVTIITFCSAILRKYSGGAHCSSPLRCSVLSIITVSVLVSLAKFIYSLQPTDYSIFIIVANLISVIIYYIYAPQDTPAKPIKSIKRIKSLKVKSVSVAMLLFLICTSLVYLNFDLESVLMTLGGLNQALALTKPGKVYINLSDIVLKTVIR